MTTSIRKLIKDFFDADQWAYQESDVDDGLMLNFGGKNGTWRCYARIREEAGQFIFYSFAPIEVPSELYLTMADFITRANFGMFIGNFEFNFATGTLQFRTSIDVEGESQHLTQGILKHLVYQNVLTMDKYLPGIVAILDDGIEPAQAIQIAEGG